MDKQKAAGWLTQAVIWFLPVTLAVIGVVYAFGAEWRTDNPAYSVPKVLLPMPVWGAMFLAIAAYEVIEHLRQNHTGMVLAKMLGAGLCLIWAAMLAGSWILHWGEALVVVPMLFLAIAFYHLGVVAYLVRTG